MSLPEGTRYGKHWGTLASLHGSPTGRTRSWHGAGGTSHTLPALPPRKPELSSIENTGIRAGSIIAHRIWLLEWSPGVPAFALRSVAIAVYWPETGIMTGDVSQYGVHSYKTVNGAEEFSFCIRIWPNLTTILGTVAIWGQVVEHQQGYRSEFAKVKSLDHIYGKDRHLLDEVKAYYKV